MRSIRQLTFVLALTAVFLARAGAQEVDNPQYKSWSKFAVGTAVHMQSEMSMPDMGMTMAQQVTTTLLELAADKAVIETSIVMGGRGATKNKSDVKAKTTKGNEYLPPGATGTTKEIGKETIEAAGKKYECTIYEFTGTMNQGQGTGKFWRNDTVPGGLVKLEMDIQMSGRGAGDMAMKVSMKSILTSIEAK